MEEKVTTEATDIAYPVEQELSRPPTLSAEEERRLWRKIDLRLLPILIIMYLVASIDRSNIGEYFSNLSSPIRAGSLKCLGNAKLQGLLTQLNLTGDQYNVALVSVVVVRLPGKV